MNEHPAARGEGLEHVRELARSFWYSAILRAAIKLDVLAILDGRSLTVEELSERIGASTRHVRAFLDACVVLGLLETRGDAYTNTQLASAHLVRGKETYAGDHALHHTNTWMSWGRLDEVIRDGKALVPPETGYVDTSTYWNNYMWGQHNRATTGQARHLIGNVDLRGRRRLLDLGGGAASYSMALCDAYPNLSAVVIDQKEPISIARGLVRERNLERRIRLVEGDFFEADLGEGYDVALISGVVVIKSKEDCLRLFRLAYEYLEPGGTIIIQDFMRIESTPERTRLDTLENLYVMVVFDSQAGDRQGTEVAGWLEEAGFQNPRLVPVPAQLVLLIAEKPPG